MLINNLKYRNIDKRGKQMEIEGINFLGIDENLQRRKIEEFKIELSDLNYSVEDIINKHLLSGTPYIFADDNNKFFALKTDIANFFGVSQTKVYVIGSAKLGFSIAPWKRYKPFDVDSDIDVAIIDETTFLRYWKMLYQFNIDIRAKTTNEEKIYREFLEYFFKGWLRPDKFPSTMNEKQKWFDFFKSLQRKYKYKIAAGIYYDEEVFIGYNKNNLESIRGEICDE